jgi:hypothetical protein
MANQKKKAGTSKYKGVWLHSNGRWYAYLMESYKKHHLGGYATEIEAALAYDAEARKRWGEHAAYNFPLPGEQSCLRTA